jgi:hypothetical protein
MEVITKEAAKEQGLIRYFTGEPCKKGHISERDIRGKCLSCAKASAGKRRLAKNKQAKEWREENKSKCKESSKNDRLKHKLYFKEYNEKRKKNITKEQQVKQKEAAKRYKEANKEAKKEYDKEYYEQNKSELAMKRQENRMIIKAYKDNELVKVGFIGKAMIKLKKIIKIK